MSKPDFLGLKADLLVEGIVALSEAEGIFLTNIQKQAFIRPGGILVFPRILRGRSAWAHEATKDVGRF